MLMVQTGSRCVFYVFILKTENKGQKLTHHIVDLIKLFMVFQKDPSWVLFHSIYTYSTRPMKAEISILQVMLTTILHIRALKN